MGEWMFGLDEIVILAIGGKGIVTMLGIDKEGQKYYVQTDNGGNWWKAEQLSGEVV